MKTTTKKKKKKILLLGGASQQIVAIDTAKSMGLYTILCDYLTDNPGQHHADKFYLVSTTDREAVLDVAEKENIDGIVAYASDPAAPTAAYVAEKLELPTNPFDSVRILCNKDLFRSYLMKNGFNTPRAQSFRTMEEILSGISAMNYPVLVKPVDSSGSKGVSVVEDDRFLRKAAETAFSFSRCRRVIIEEYIEKDHPYQIGGDIFVLKGEIVQWGLMNSHRNAGLNTLVPTGNSYPVQLSDRQLSDVKDVLKRLVTGLGMHSGPMNVELIIDKEGRVFPIDIGPRSGGNMIPDLLGMVFQCDLVKMTIQAAMGIVIDYDSVDPKGYYASFVVHSEEAGRFKGITVEEEINRYIVQKVIYKTTGDDIKAFSNASSAIGILFLRFDDRETMIRIMDEINDGIVVKVEK